MNHANELALAKKLLDAEAATIAGLSGRLDERFHAAVDLIVNAAERQGTILVSGLGKSGLIGAKISATLASLGIPSHFVHPAEAAHGDLGRFRKADVCIALSYSGETDEVVNLAAILKQDQVPVISITRDGTTLAPASASSLDRLATVGLAIGAPPSDDPELSPAPTCSTIAMLAIGDALALCAAKRRDFSDDDFAKHHPGGALGGMLRPITEVLRFTAGKNLSTIDDHVSVAQALKAAEATNARRPGALLLIDGRSGKLTGIFTDADLRRLILRSPSDLERPVHELMTRNPSTLPDSALVRDAVRMVRESRRDEIPVIDAAGKPVGILDVQDLVALKLIRSE